MRTVGPKYGKLLNKIRQVLPTLDGNKAMDELRAPIDKLEMIVDKDVWPMPSYGDLIFEV